MSKPVGPYTPAVKAGDFVFTSGQIPIIDGQIVTGGIEIQFKQALDNLKTVIESQSASLNQVIKTTIFVTDMSNYASINDIYINFFGDHRPARSVVQVSALPLEALIEIEAVLFQG